jgi:hypothetical protein
MTQPAPNPDDRILEALRAIIREEFPRLKYAGEFLYAITEVTGEPPNVKISCSPVDQTIGLPDLNSLPCQPDLSGITSIPTAGLNCVIVFLNCDPTLPRIKGVDSLGINPVARLGDQVTVFLPPTLAIQGIGSTTGPFAGSITVLNPVTGVISQGSGQVFTG